MIVSSQPQKVIRPWLIVTLICVLFVLGKTNVTYPLTTMMRAVMFPVLEGNRYTKSIVRNEWATFTQLRAQRLQIEQLKEENTRLAAENSYLKILKEEQKNWYTQKKLTSLPEVSLIPAVILYAQDTMTLTIKAKAQIPEKSVIVSNNNLVGIVRSQQGQTVSAKAMTHSEIELPVAIVGKDGLKGRGVIAPSYGTILQATHVLQNIAVEIGDDVMLLPTSDWPDNIRVGSVERIIKRESDVFQNLVIKQDLDLNKIFDVLIYVFN